MKPPHILIVGAGIVGASIAWHLVRAGASVSVFDANEPGGVATRNSWGWINASWGNAEPYFRLRVHAMQEWRRLEQEVPDLSVDWAGSLLWELPPDELRSFQADHAAWGYNVRLVERAGARAIEPHLAVPPQLAVHAPEEGAVEPLAAAQALLAAAQGYGAIIAANRPVGGLIFRGQRVIGAETHSGPLYADEVVVASGVGTANLLAAAGLSFPMRVSPALLVRTRPHAKRLNGLIMSPVMQLRQIPDGRLIGAVSIEDVGSDADGEQAAAAFDAMKDMLIAATSLVFESWVVGHRPIPGDGLPTVGRYPGVTGLYVAVTHSGVTLAPAIGRCVADELLTGKRDSLIKPYGVERFIC
jgi:glycine/D-amino acid oxidase-like deaminating enzyme